MRYPAYVKARKQYICDGCDEDINVGEKYVTADARRSEVFHLGCAGAYWGGLRGITNLEVPDCPLCYGTGVMETPDGSTECYGCEGTGEGEVEEA